jgi:CPA2 family monovalent cation:H+ antiporter-2
MHPDPQRLSEIPLFEGLTGEQLEQIASWFDVEEHPAGTRLTREGASGYAFFILDQGRARVEHDGTAIDELRPGDAFGEMAFLSDGRRKADVFADTEVGVMAMFGTRFRELQALAPEVTQRLEAIARDRSDTPEGQTAAG